MASESVAEGGVSQVNAELPRHVAIILDGNRRWGLERLLGRPWLGWILGRMLTEEQRMAAIKQGHNRGMEVFSQISQYLLADVGVEYVSAYAFSKENWNREEEEVSHLMQLVVVAMERYLQEFHAKDIRLLHLGSEEGLPPETLEAIRNGVEVTKNNKGGVLAIALNYSGRQEIAEAAQAAARSGQAVTEETIDEHIWLPELPPVDLLIRTSGEQRTSGFHNWRGSYAELYFLKKHWPSVKPRHIRKALQEYSKRQRRHGR